MTTKQTACGSQEKKKKTKQMDFKQQRYNSRNSDSEQAHRSKKPSTWNASFIKTPASLLLWHPNMSAVQWAVCASCFIVIVTEMLKRSELLVLLFNPCLLCWDTSKCLLFKHSIGLHGMDVSWHPLAHVSMLSLTPDRYAVHFVFFWFLQWMAFSLFLTLHYS